MPRLVCTCSTKVRPGKEAHLLTQIELHALRFQLLLDQLAHLRVKLGQKLLLFSMIRTLRPSLRKDFAISKPAQLPPRITMVPHIGGADELLEEDQIFHGLEGLHAHAVTAGHLRTRLEEPVASTSLS